VSLVKIKGLSTIWISQATFPLSEYGGKTKGTNLTAGGYYPEIKHGGNWVLLNTHPISFEDG
tara:strand:- start:454 stop:639 length:186 start_codon:yes stop_codon:yes gene_type:complete